MAIRILIAYGSPEGRAQLERHLEGNAGFELVGSVENGREALDLAASLRVDVLLVDANLPRPGALEVAQRVIASFPDTGIILVSARANPEEMRKAMLAGASDYLIEPVEREDLIQSLTSVYERLQGLRRTFAGGESGSQEKACKIVTVYSPRGGVGKSLLAANTAVALAQGSGQATALVDLDLLFGNLDLLLNVTPERTIASLIPRTHQLDADLLQGFMTPYDEIGLRILPAPSRPNHADAITATLVERVITTLREQHRYIVIDTSCNLRDTTLTALEVADTILLIVVPDLLALQSTQVVLEMMRQLRYREDKIRVVLNRANAEGGIAPEDVERTLNIPVDFQVPNDVRTAVTSINEGVPFVLSQPDNPITKAVHAICRAVAGQPNLFAAQTDGAGPALRESGRRGLLRFLFGSPA